MIRRGGGREMRWWGGGGVEGGMVGDRFLHRLLGGGPFFVARKHSHHFYHS